MMARPSPQQVARAIGSSRLFRVDIGPCENPRLSFVDRASDSITAQLQNMCHAKEGERVSARPLEQARFPVLAERSALETARLREAIPEAELVAADLARNANKGQRLAAVNDSHALDLQVRMQGYIGGLPR